MPIEILADLDEIEPGTQEWLKLRKQGIGGSDAGAVVGLSRFRTPYQVWAEKVNPNVEEREESEPQLWGKLLEAPVRDEFSRRTGIEVHRLPKMIRNTSYPFMLVNVDGVTGPTTSLTGAYEGKTTRFADHWPKNDDGSVTVPLEYVVQGMHTLGILENLERVYYACLIGGQELRIAEVERNQPLIDDLIEIEEKFWQQVVDREPPPVGPEDVATLRKRWQPKAGTAVEVPATFVPTLKVRWQRVAQIKAHQEDIDRIDAELMAAMGDAEEATVAGKGVIATWKASTRTTIDTKALKRDNPYVAEEFSVTTTSRRFLPKELS